ncbi:putative sarcosine oxidase [Phaeomoniella chlamydospora]|uniref:Putative sarcosine oxidase n=1 Tax=Phaeomoniella chlamydospora TaxID=158046 RepID=A0A0G2GJQ6_PHACM|nr:putative sarcosine oxidase [Phaeomoniella chlamydospora]
MAITTPSPLSPDSKILVLGSGVFGLSTALWLARSSYTDITVLDMQDLASKSYNPGLGIDSASADINKIIRFSYGTEIEYQRLAFEAAGMWNEWNRDKEKELGRELGEQEKLWFNSGMLRMSAVEEFGEFELRTLENMEKEGIRDEQFRSDYDDDIKRATERGWAHKLDPCCRKERSGYHKAVLDSTAGYVAAYKSCDWARQRAEGAGVKFVLDPVKGKAVGLGRSEENGKPTVKTADGQVHVADLIVVACGGWTPSLLPECSHILETTAGSIGTIQLPKDRKDLWERFAPENFPVLTWGIKEGMGIYSFPRDENGIIKIGYRGTKFTNFDDVNGGHRMSVPKTAHVTEKKETNIPMISLEAMREYISVNLPELLPLGLSSTKLCWYTDSIDNSFVIDYVPGRSGVAVCSGGSGHGFKFLPILGREVVKILEGKGRETVYGNMWKWREGPKDGKRNGLEEGEDGERVLAKQEMATPQEWKL